MMALVDLKKKLPGTHVESCHCYSESQICGPRTQTGTQVPEKHSGIYHAPFRIKDYIVIKIMQCSNKFTRELPEEAKISAAQGLCPCVI